MGTVPERAAVGHGPRGLQRRRQRLELLHPRPGALPRLQVGRGRARRNLRRQAAAVLRAGAVERARPDPEGAPLRAHQQRGQPRRGREGVLLLPRQHADALVHEVPVQVPAARVSLPGPDRDQPQTIARRVRVRAARYRRLRRRPLLRRVRRIREGRPGRRAGPHHRPQSRAGSGAAARPADAVVPQHLVVGRGRAQAVAARRGVRARFRPRTPSWASTGSIATAPRSCSSPRTRAMRSVSGASPTRRPTSRMRSTPTSSRDSARR